jgi:selenocysteine lyase/cysteine desulfurase
VTGFHLAGIQWVALAPIDLWKECVEMSKWEYKIINIRSENYRLDPNAATQLNQLGEEGWELVSITSVNFKTGATDNIAMVFKRPVAG